MEDPWKVNMLLILMVGVCEGTFLRVTRCMEEVYSSAQSNLANASKTMWRILLNQETCA